MIRGISWALIYNQIEIFQVLQRSPIPQTSNWSGTFFAVSYSKPALGCNIVPFSFSFDYHSASMVTAISDHKRAFTVPLRRPSKTIEIAKMVSWREFFKTRCSILLIVLLVVRVEIDSITAKPYILQKSLLQ